MTDLARENYTLRVKLHDASRRIAELQAELAKGKVAVVPPPKLKHRAVPASRAGRIYQEALADAEEYLGVSGFGDRRPKSSGRVMARRIAWYVLRNKMQHLSWSETERIVGCDHSSIMVGLRKLVAQLDTSAELRAFVSGLLGGNAEAAE